MGIQFHLDTNSLEWILPRSQSIYIEFPFPNNKWSNPWKWSCKLRFSWTSLFRLFTGLLQKKGKREVYNSQIDLFRGTAIFRSRIVFEMRRRALTNPDERQISQWHKLNEPLSLTNSRRHWAWSRRGGASCRAAQARCAMFLLPPCLRPANTSYFVLGIPCVSRNLSWTNDSPWS